MIHSVLWGPHGCVYEGYHLVRCGLVHRTTWRHIISSQLASSIGRCTSCECNSLGQSIISLHFVKPEDLLLQGSTNFPKIQERSQYSRHQKGDEGCSILRTRKNLVTKATLSREFVHPCSSLFTKPRHLLLSSSGLICPWTCHPISSGSFLHYLHSMPRSLNCPSFRFHHWRYVLDDNPYLFTIWRLFLKMGIVGQVLLPGN